MSPGTTFTPDDYRQMESLGVNPDRVREHLQLFARRSHFLTLDRPCTLGDGIQQVPADEIDACLEKHAQAARQGRFLKFVPASGAATRMFQVPLKLFHFHAALSRADLARECAEGSSEARDFLALMDNLPRLACFPDLQACLRRQGQDISRLLAEGRFRPVLEALLTPTGLNCAALPKGLLKFHTCPDGGRTAFAEHLHEAAGYVMDKDRLCRLHFTVSRQFHDDFLELCRRLRPELESRLNCRFQVDFSLQKTSTDTIAADAHHRPFRDASGRLHFRPGGHGALLENLNDLQADLVYIKNIDNIVPDRLQEGQFFWKKLLGGCLVQLQARLHHYLRLLEDPGQPLPVADILDFLQRRLGLSYRSHFRHWPEKQQRHYLWERLHRPLRVCGMVKNTGEPGGGPFWVQGRDGRLTPQIVEAAQVDFSSTRQQEIWRSSTHFNPVDLVCALRDHHGHPFDLTRFVDPEAVFISSKTCEGRALQALELPGLWNGAMAGWLTVFVEVPLSTFNPVKTVLDLLRPEHQQA